MSLLNICLILNGPPGCGKDTLAKLFLERAGFAHHEMKAGLYEKTAKYFNMELGEFVRIATDRDLKEQPERDLRLPRNSASRHITPREALIHVSEKVYKPNYGNDYFGQLAADRCLALGNPNVVFSDGGFPEEIAPLEKIFAHVVIARLHRKGYSFEGDSRNYLEGFPKSFDVGLLEDEPDEAYDVISQILEFVDMSDFSEKTG